MKPKRLPKTSWDVQLYNQDYYAYGDVDIFIDTSNETGERVICLFRKRDIKKYEDENCNDFTLAILCNNCGIASGIKPLLGLNAGQIVPVQFNGEFNPTIPLEWIDIKFWEL